MRVVIPKFNCSYSDPAYRNKYWGICTARKKGGDEFSAKFMSFTAKIHLTHPRSCSLSQEEYLQKVPVANNASVYRSIIITPVLIGVQALSCAIPLACQGLLEGRK